MSEGIALRRFRLADLGALEHVTRASWAGVTIHDLIEARHGPIGGLSWDLHKWQEVRSQCLEIPDQIWVAELAGQIVGYAMYHLRANGKVGIVGNNAVLPECRGKGIGRRLIEQVVDDLLNAEVEILQVMTMEQDFPARHIYEAIGFQEIARTIHYTVTPAKVHANRQKQNRE
ncbi:MAG: GNAT family N-acetyltransferase [Chloroflexi bacterium]|nr:GNAT family N-acetyltransferase [Chloroflexota bacterium]